MNKSKNYRWLHCIPLLMIVGYLGWHMLFTTHYPQLKWWQYNASDFECGVTTSALGLINDARPVNHVLYPAVTLYNYEAASLRLAALFNSHDHDVFNVNGFKNIKEVFGMLNKATNITRVSVLPMNIFWMIIMYFLFYWILKSRALACIWALLFFTEEHVNYYNIVMRPETFSLAFYFLAVLLSIYFFQRFSRKFSYQRCLKYFTLIGFFVGLSIFSKIQIFPALILYFGLMFFYLFKESAKNIQYSGREVKFCLFNTIGNVLIFPWWTMFRPDHVTPELLRRWPWHDLYGPPPGKENFMEIPVIIFIGIFSFTLVLMALSQQKKGEQFIRRLTPLFMYINMLITGIIISIYVTGLGGWTSFSGYAVNTQNFVYSTISNFYFAGQMDHKIMNMDNFRRIYNEFIHVPFSFFSFFYVLVVGFLWAVLRFILKGTNQRSIYFYSILMFGLAFGFDILATLRAKVYMYNYGIYSVSFYFLGLVFLMSGEWRYVRKIKLNKIRLMISGIIGVIFVSHMFIASSKVVKYHHNRIANYSGDYKLQFNHCIWQSKFFWDMVEADLYASESFKETREAGRRFKWGQKNQQILKQIKGNDITKQFIVPEDKRGKLDELMRNYTYQIQYKAYLYNFILAASDQLAKQGQVDAALANYGQAIETFPYLPEAYQKRAQLNYRKQNYPNSLEDIKAAQRLGATIDLDFLRKAKRAASSQ